MTATQCCDKCHCVAAGLQRVLRHVCLKLEEEESGRTPDDRGADELLQEGSPRRASDTSGVSTTMVCSWRHPHDLVCYSAKCGVGHQQIDPPPPSNLSDEPCFLRHAMDRTGCVSGHVFFEKWNTVNDVTGYPRNER